MSAVLELGGNGGNTPCDFGQMFGCGMQGMMGGMGMMGGVGMMGQTIPQNCLQSGYYGMGMMGGMMGAWTPPADLAPQSGTLTLDEAVKIGERYVTDWVSDQTLKLSEIMQFDNQFYGEVASNSRLDSSLKAVWMRKVQAAF